MEDGAEFPNVVGSNPSMEFDFMDELLFEGCWLEADDELNPSPSTPCNMLNSTSCDDLVACGKSADQLNPTPPPKSQLETQSLDFSINPLSDPPLIEEESIGPQSQDHRALQISTLGEGSTDPSQRWWIGPATDPGPSSSVRERLMMAISYIKGSARGRNALIQIWVPVKKGGKHVLTTDNQPFSIDPNSHSLANYRNVSKKYHFPADEDSTESVGLPGRVFLGRVPEWTPDVRFFRSDEYPRISYAWRYQVCASLALPIFEHSSGTCLGVLEVVTTSQKMKYRLELENVCKALEAVNLRSSQISIPPSVKDCNKSYKAATPEIAETLKILCKMHDLPLAQTWAPCIQQGKAGCWHSGKNNGHCLSTVDLASSAADRQVLGFHEACSEHHLLSHQGIVGRASTTNQLCFETDIAAYGKTEYPLSHHARMIGLRAAVAIRLRSIYTTSEDFILEFFLPPACQDVEEQNQKLNSLSVFLHQASWGLRAITDQELDEEPMPVGEFAVSPLGRFNSKEIVPAAPSKDPSSEESSWITQIMEAQHKENGASVELPQMEFKITTSRDKAAVELHRTQAYDSSPKSSADQELEEEPMPVGEFAVSPLERFNSKEIVKIVPAAPSKRPSSEESSWIAQMIEAQQKENGASVASPQTEFKITASQDKAAMELHRAQAYDSGPKSTAAGGLGSSSFGAHSSLGVRKSDKKRQSKTEKTISLQVLQQYFAGSLKDAAKSIGVCPTTLKRICRQHGINRWPSRKIKKVDHSLRKLQLVIDSVQGVDGGVKIGSFYKSFPGLSSASPTGGNTFSKLKMTKQLKQIDSEPQPQPERGPSTHGATTRSPSSSCSHSSSSSYCCSTVAKQHSVMVNAPSSGDTVTAENPGMVLKRGSNDAELQVEGLAPLRKSSGQDLRNGGAFKVKANFGEEKIHFSLQENQSFEDLQQEIASRFCLDDTGKIDLKYLDDDSEWVLLTCDADLEECIDLHKSARNRTIRLSLHQASHLHSRSLGSTCPS